MNKLTALSKLASAYWDIYNRTSLMDEATADAMLLIEDNFGYIRRSLRIEDLKPQPKNTEGLNPAGPKFF